MWYKTSKDDFQRFDAAFSIITAFINEIHDDVCDWVTKNIDRWRADKEEWFQIEMIPYEFLQRKVLEGEGGKKRRRSSAFGGEIGGLPEHKYRVRVHPDG